MRYHSYTVIFDKETTDYNGDIAQQFVVILGGDKKISIENQLLDILEKNL